VLVVTVTTTFSKWENKDAHFYIKMPIFPYTLGKSIVFFLLPEAFCSLKYAENVPRIPLGELTTLPQPPLVGWEADTPPHTPPHSATGGVTGHHQVLR